MEPIQVKILDLGYMTFYKKELVRTDDLQEMIQSPALAILIKHPTAGYILYDTGNDDNWQNTYSDHIKEVYPITECITIKEALAKEGLAPENIDVLVLSHLHFDHAGGMKYFANTKAGAHTLVAAAEWDEVAHAVPQAKNQQQGAYLGELFLDLPGVAYEPVADENIELAEGVTLFTQHCHTAGLLGLCVRLVDRTVIFTGDTVYTRESYEQELPPGGSINKTDSEFTENIAALKVMQKTYDAEMFFGHDYAQARAWEKKGWIE